MKTRAFITPLGFAALAVAGLFACQTPAPADRAAENEEVVYGPYDTTYELPDVSGSIYYVAPDGDAGAEGTTLENPTTIEAAISRVVTDDAIVMRGGTYRTGDLTFNQGITIQPYQDEKPVLNGTFVADKWQQDSDGVWVTDWERFFPGEPQSWWNKERNIESTPMHRFNNDCVFVNGDYLQSVGSKDELEEGTFFVDYDAKKIFLGTDPSGQLVEITAFNNAIIRTPGDVHGKTTDKRGPVIKGIEVTQYADISVLIDGLFPEEISPEEAHGNDAVGTVFENCSFTKALRVAVFAHGDSLVMRNCKIEDTNTEGLYIVASDDVLLERNIFAHNNIENWRGYFPAAVKIFNQSHRVVCRENLVTNQPNSNGIWYDVGNVDGVFVNNRVENVGQVDQAALGDKVWVGRSGFFFEISEGVIVAGNEFVNNNQGILILNAAGAEMYNNTFINSRASFGRTARGDGADHFGWHVTSGPGVEERENHVFVNNLMIDTVGMETPMLYVWQPSEMCERLNKSTLKAINNNVYVKVKKEESPLLALWSPAQNDDCQARISDPADLNALYEPFETNSKFYNGFDESLFSGDAQIISGFEGHQFASDIPGNVKKLAGWSNVQINFIGAR